MIFLDATTKKIQAVMSGAAATTNPKSTVCKYFQIPQTDISSAGSGFGFITSRGTSQIVTLSGASDVDICDAPQTAGYVVVIEYMGIHNDDSANVTVTWKWDVSGTDTKIKTMTLAPNETGYYQSGSGWGRS